MPTDERSTPPTLGGRIRDALVGRRIDRTSSIRLSCLNLAAFLLFFFALLCYMLSAAMAAGTTTPAMDQWLSGMLWALGTGTVACLYTGVVLAAAHRWPRAVQYLALAALVAVVLLHISVPPGIYSPLPDA